MTKPIPQTPFNPTRFDLLRRASFLTDAHVRENLDSWDAQIDWQDHLHLAEFRLLPQLHRNVAALGIQHARLGKFKGIARKV